MGSNKTGKIILSQVKQVPLNQLISELLLITYLHALGVSKII